MPSSIFLTGQDLTIEMVDQIIRDCKVLIDIGIDAKKVMKKSRLFLENTLSERIIYGVNTGFGPMARHIINSENLEELQANLIYSHAVGMGQAIKKEYVLAAMLVRLNTLCEGYSGVSLELVEHLRNFVNNRIIPIIPEHGAVGASGELVQLSHIALALIGYGGVIYRDSPMPAAEALQRTNLKSYRLKAKEGLSLINGTSVMTGIGALICIEANKLLGIAVCLGALALEVVHAYDDSLSELLHATRPHHGQKIIAGSLRKILASSGMLRKREDLHRLNKTKKKVIEISDNVQEYYSLRCIPQILGPIFDILTKVKKEVNVEMNSATDNPIV